MLMTEDYCGHNIPDKLCFRDRLGEIDDCATCKETCEQYEGVCERCPIQEAFDRLAEYEQRDPAITEKPEKRTNADRIRAMTDEELAELLDRAENEGYNDSSITPKDSHGFPMDILELLLNACYLKGGESMYRTYELDISARGLTMKLLDKFAGIPNEFTCDEDFDERMAEYLKDYLQNGIDKVKIEGLISVFYWHLLAMGELRERLKG